MRKLYLLLSVGFLLNACGWLDQYREKQDEVTQVISPKSYRINKDEFFTKSLLVKQFYKENDYFTIWFDQDNREAFLNQVVQLEQEGFDLSKLDVPYLLFSNSRFDKLNVYEKINVDLAFTDAFFRTIKQLVHGKVNPNKYYSDWVAPQKIIDFNKLLFNGINDKNIEVIIKQQIPDNKYYNGIKEAMALYESLPKDTLLHIRAHDFSKIKKKLAYFSDFESNDYSNNINEDFIYALKKFQKRHGIYPSGNITEETLIALNVSKEKRQEQLRVNLERARWFYNDLGENYVLVNLPECKLFLYENGNLVETHDVIIGKNERKTPILSSSFSNLVVNPTWTIPPTILKNDVVPRATSDRSYFVNHRLTIYDRNGRIVSPEEWKPEFYKNYRYVQKPGSNNALGLIKFDFPNGHSVYLHDTNNRSMFDKKKRDLSSGCVRVKDPFELATRILEIEESSYNRAYLDTLVSREKTKYLKLKKKVNVHQMYWTAWKDDQGIQFRDDIYSLDDNLYKRLIK